MSLSHISFKFSSLNLCSVLRQLRPFFLNWNEFFPRYFFYFPPILEISSRPHTFFFHLVWSSSFQNGFTAPIKTFSGKGCNIICSEKCFQFCMIQREYIIHIASIWFWLSISPSNCNLSKRHSYHRNMRKSGFLWWLIYRNLSPFECWQVLTSSSNREWSGMRPSTGSDIDCSNVTITGWECSCSNHM